MAAGGGALGVVEDADDLEPGRGGEGVALEAHAELAHDDLGGEVVVLGGGDEAGEVEAGEGVVDEGLGRFGGVAAVLVVGVDGPEEADLGGGADGVGLARAAEAGELAEAVEAGDVADDPDEGLLGFEDDGEFAVGGLAERGVPARVEDRPLDVGAALSQGGGVVDAGAVAEGTVEEAVDGGAASGTKGRIRRRAVSSSTGGPPCAGGVGRRDSVVYRSPAAGSRVYLAGRRARTGALSRRSPSA